MFREEKREEIRLEPEVVEVNGRLMLLDQRYPSSPRGIIKVLEIVFCFLALLLTGISQPVRDERSLPLVFSSLGVIVAFVLLLSYVLALNHRVPSTPWFFVEVFFYVVLVFGLLCGALFMWIFCASHWADINPEWEFCPAIAAATLFICSGIFLVDLIMLLKNWKRWSWHPHEDKPEEQERSRNEVPY